MPNTVSTAFVAQYNSDMHLAYQRARLLNATVRTAEAIGSTYIFQKLGKGTATIKARNGNVVPMNPAHDTATATLEDRYAPEYCDKLDLEKLTVDERGALQKTSVYALGRYQDSQIIDILNAHTGTSTNNITYVSTNITVAKIADWIMSGLFGNDVPDDGQVTAVIGYKEYGTLMALQQFTGWEYIGEARKWDRASGAVKWMNCVWIPHSGLSKNATSGGATSFAYHKTAIGQAIGSDIQTQIDWIPEKVAWLIDAWLSMGAVAIDSEGISMTGNY
jgi:hypothetical protein